MPIRILICLLLGLTACTSQGGTPNRAASPSALPSAGSAVPSPSPSPSPAAAPLIVAVQGKSGSLTLYAVAAGSHTAAPLRRLGGPAGAVVSGVSLSAGAAPTVCAIWSPHTKGSTAPDELRCYLPGATQGRVVAHHVYTVGLRADGRAVAWTDLQPNQGFVVADLAGDVATVRSRTRYVEEAPADAGVPESLDDVDWIGPDTVVGTATGDSDESAGLCVIDLANPHPRVHEGQGLGRCFHPSGREGKLGYAHFEKAALVQPGIVVTTERTMGCCDDENAPHPHARAVRMRLSDGAVLAVFATPRAGRDVVDVSGGARAVLYTTGVIGEQFTDAVVSLRWAGDAHGAPLTGLPADLTRVTAQP